MKKTTTYIIILLTLFSCEEIIELDLPLNSPRLVVDGLITNDTVPYTITLSKTTKYSYEYDTKNIDYVENALVVVNDDAGNSDTLQEVNPGSYQTDSLKMIGVVGRSYSLEVTLQDGTRWLTKPETMLPVADIDSIYFERDIYDRSETSTTAYRYWVYVDWQDPANENNYYLRNISYYWNDQWQNDYVWNWVFDDKYIDGKDIQRSQIIQSYGGKYFYVRLNQYSLTREAYKFWKLVHEQTSLSGNSITNSAVPLYGNVYNEQNPDEYALGYFQVSAVTSGTVYIDR